MLCLLLAYPARLCVLARRQGRSAQRVALAMSCVVLWFFMAMRAQTVGVDTKYYVCIYQQFPQISWKELFTAQLYPTPRRTWELDLEPGYRLLNKLLSIYLPAPQWITVANSALIIALLYRWLRRESPNAMLSIWLYLTLGVYQTEMNVARNAIAILLGYTAFHWIKERKLAPYFLQILMAVYGTYSTWVSAADLVYWVLFSGITKCNTFYLSNKGTELRRFKAKYYSCYVLPVLTTLALVLTLEKGRGGYTVIALITGMELLVMDHSSTMMAQGQPGCALFGEYVLGRLFLVLGTLVLYKTERLSLGTLLALYVIQYAGILVLFLIKRDREPRRDISKELSLRKWGSYQRADLIQALISQMPILLQYFFTGAFEAGIVSVVLMVKKLVNFISGPTAKVFLPEFSRMYHAGNKAGIKQCYASIMRIQMLFAGSMAVVLVGYPQVLLSILAEELLPYTKQFVGCALVFILIATLGPCSGVLQMTGNEKKDNLYREAALGVMLVLLFVMRGSRLVMLYALCVQALLEGVVKYWYVCRWMQGSAVKLKTYCIWWSVPAAVIAGGCLLHLQHSALAMLLAAGGTFAFGLVCELRPGGCLHGYWEGLKKKFEKT